MWRATSDTMSSAQTPAPASIVSRGNAPVTPASTHTPASVVTRYVVRSSPTKNAAAIATTSHATSGHPPPSDARSRPPPIAFTSQPGRPTSGERSVNHCADHGSSRTNAPTAPVASSWKRGERPAVLAPCGDDHRAEREQEQQGRRMQRDGDGEREAPIARRSGCAPACPRPRGDGARTWLASHSAAA